MQSPLSQLQPWPRALFGRMTNQGTIKSQPLGQEAMRVSPGTTLNTMGYVCQIN